MLFLSSTLRPSFRIYLLVASFVFVLHTIAVHFLSELTWQDGSMGSLVLGIGIYITVMGSLGHDRRERRSGGDEDDVAARADRRRGRRALRVKKNGRGGIWPSADRPVLSVVGPGTDEVERRSA
jgi:hypothetical protein